MELNFKYKGIDQKGNILQGVYQAKSREDVLAMLREKGHRPVKIEQVESKSQNVSDIGIFKPRVKLKDTAIFCKQLYTMLNAGMPLSSCLEVLGEQTENKTLRESIRDVYSQVQTGTILSQAMRSHKKVFPNLLITMVEAGEMTGNLDTVLQRMSDHFEKENKINSKIKGAMVYPIILSIAAVAVVIFLLTFIMPTFTGMFTSSGVELPGPTRMLMAMSDAIRNFWYIWLAVIIGAGYLLNQYRKTVDGRRNFDRLNRRLPVISPATTKIATSRFTRTLSTLIASGIPIVQAMEAAASVTNNQIVIDGMHHVIEEMKKGLNISYLLKNMNFFPPMVISMVGIGEESGALEEMLSKTADYYDEELEASIQKMLSMLEPMLILIMGIVIGFIVIAMMLPIFDLSTTMG